MDQQSRREHERQLAAAEDNLGILCQGELLRRFLDRASGADPNADAVSDLSDPLRAAAQRVVDEEIALGIRDKDGKLIDPEKKE